ncbi:GNAT family N-acetyltransferase [Thermostaphylospora chromogena]|uniref:Protein N-acetyltransferase, RimJ/RimL family n=1 Tax=Thermostaphylospora chromogena TaxID=35622 RepID=A0A1H1CZU9_9ACTN|nr:GNAT family N-acetyltransferase [Thermostaphylospora chromogena]SDQ69732.1 Protein N-acetyltransferase, RimJ/RimL family [Thermostaphylospora chromogena]
MNTHSDVGEPAPHPRSGPAAAGVLTTARLTLSPWHERYADDLVRLSGDERVMRLISSGTWTREYARERHRQALRQWRDEGFGMRAILRDGRFAGLVSLTTCAQPDVAAPALEIGWWIDPAEHGRGIATEAATAVRDEAFRLGAATLVARCHPANHASERIMIKLGMTLHGDGLDRYGHPCRVYTLPRPGPRDDRVRPSTA